MPVLESTDAKITPKSILRHRPIGATSGRGKRGGQATTVIPPVAKRASREQGFLVPPADAASGRKKGEEAGLEIAEWKYTRTGGQKTQPVSKGASTTKPLSKSLSPTSHAGTKTVKETPVRPQLPKLLKVEKGPAPQLHPLSYLGLGMIAMLVLWMLVSTLFAWVSTTADDIRYGRPRTFQTDAWVGHNEQTGIPSHFIAINLNRRIEIIEIAGGDAGHTRIYTGPQLYGADADLTPVTLQFVDVNNDHKADMIICFQNSQVVFINDRGGFRPLLPTERPTVEPFLQHLKSVSG